MAQERRQQAAAANAVEKLKQLEKADQKTKMKGKNRPSRFGLSRQWQWRRQRFDCQ